MIVVVTSRPSRRADTGGHPLTFSAVWASLRPAAYTSSGWVTPPTTASAPRPPTGSHTSCAFARVGISPGRDSLAQPVRPVVRRSAVSRVAALVLADPSRAWMGPQAGPRMPPK